MEFQSSLNWFLKFIHDFVILPLESMFLFTKRSFAGGISTELLLASAVPVRGGHGGASKVGE